MSSANSNSGCKEERLATDSPEPDSKRVHYEEDSADEDDVKGSKSSQAKKLASGKRADQNRKAQRAFRQRKDKYIKDLELRSQELDIANSLIIQLKEENDRLNEIAKSFHSRVNELEAQLMQIANAQTGQQVRRPSAHFSPSSPRAEEQPYYSQRGGPSRNQNSQQPYGPNGQVGSVYSQSKGLI